MSSVYRITYPKQSSLDIESMGLSSILITRNNRKIIAPGRMELSSDTGEILRLKEGASFAIEDTHEGVQPVVEGELFSISTGSWLKSSTSCYSCRLHSSPPLQLLVRPSVDEENADEYLLMQGDMIIHDFDENGKHFTICTLSGGEKATLKYDVNLPVSPERYSSSVKQMVDSEYEYILKNYLDPRLWIVKDDRR